MIQPDRVADEVCWKTVAMVRVLRLLHATILAQGRRRPPVNVTMPLRGTRDFDDLPSYRRFIDEVIGRANAGRDERRTLSAALRQQTQSPGSSTSSFIQRRHHYRHDSNIGPCQRQSLTTIIQPARSHNHPDRGANSILIAALQRSPSRPQAEARRISGDARTWHVVSGG